MVISRESVTMDPVIPAVAKTTNRLNLILAKKEAEEKGAKEAVILNVQGFLTEGTSSNLFFVREGLVHTPSLESGILEGITRGIVMEILEKEEIEVRESLYRPEDLKSSEEAFLTFATAGVVPIRSVDAGQIGSGTAGRVTRKGMDEYGSGVDRRTSVRCEAGGG